MPKRPAKKKIVAPFNWGAYYKQQDAQRKLKLEPAIPESIKTEMDKPKIAKSVRTDIRRPKPREDTNQAAHSVIQEIIRRSESVK